MAIKQVNEGSGAQASRADNVPSLGFGSGLHLMASGNGAEYTSTIGKYMQELYAQLPDKPKVHVLDRERITNLNYSCIVVSLPNKNGEVCYHITLLSSTGLEVLKASDIVAEARRVMRDANSQARIYTPSDAINSRLNDVVLRELSAVYKDAAYIPCDGTVIPATGLVTEEVAKRAAVIAYNAVKAEAMLSGGEIADLNVRDALQMSRENGRRGLRLEYNMYPTTVLDIVGKPARQDFKVDLVEIAQETFFEMNADTTKRLLSVGGFVDAIYEDIPMQQFQPSMSPVFTRRLHPNIVITNNDALSPTQGFMFLGIAAATLMTRPELWIPSLAAIDHKSRNNPGGLNILTNIEGEQQGTPLDLSPKKVTTEQQYAVLKQMYSLSPIISYDVEVFGPNAHYASVIGAAADPNNSNRAACLDEIIQTCVQLTDGLFPHDFSTADIFATDGVVVPLGHWMDKNGERDIRDVDLAFVANQTGDMSIINKWAGTSLPHTVTGIDPYLTRVEVIEQLMPDADITGKAIRVTFTNKFITTLTQALERAGLSPRYESSVILNEQYNTSQFNDYLAAASLGNINMGSHGGVSGNSMFTPYGFMGFGR